MEYIQYIHRVIHAITDLDLIKIRFITIQRSTAFVFVIETCIITNNFCS
ncbi:MPPV-172 hypothetical protein [Magpiepox virus 2]|nr:MPPV-172 hypothetical protein [Magpiepox virus 2]